MYDKWGIYVGKYTFSMFVLYQYVCMALLLLHNTYKTISEQYSYCNNILYALGHSFNYIFYEGSSSEFLRFPETDTRNIFAKLQNVQIKTL